MEVEKYKDAAYFLQAYLHQDCALDYDSTEKLLEYLFSTVSRPKIIAIADDLSALLNLELTETELGIKLQKLGADYRFWAFDKLDCSKWLFNIVNRFYEHAYS
jgi:hypothetical protein